MAIGRWRRGRITTRIATTCCTLPSGWNRPPSNGSSDDSFSLLRGVCFRRQRLLNRLAKLCRKVRVCSDEQLGDIRLSIDDDDLRNCAYLKAFRCGAVDVEGHCWMNLQSFERAYCRRFIFLHVHGDVADAAAFEF